MQISQAGIALIKRFEGLVLETYDDGVGIQTVGYGHTGRFRGHRTVADAVEANGGQPIEITEDEAEELLRDDLRDFEDAVNRAIKAPTAQSMFDAFVSLAFNIGANAFKKSTAVKLHNKEDYTGAAEAITWWNKAGGQVLLGLVRRRAAEEAHYLEGLDEVVDPGDSGAATVEENSPRRSNPVTTRTTAGATTAGAAGAAGAGTVLLDDDEKKSEADSGSDTSTGEASTDTTEDAGSTGTDTGDSTAEDTSTEQPSGDTETGETAAGDTGEAETTDTAENEVAADDSGTTTTEGTEVSEEPTNFNDDEMQDAIVILAGVIAVLAALWVIFARIDDWRKYRR